MFGSDYEVGDCLMSVKGNDLDDNYQSSDDQDQLDIIEEQIHKKINGIKDVKQLNQIQQLSDDQIFNNEEMINRIIGGDREIEEMNTLPEEPNQEQLVADSD